MAFIHWFNSNMPLSRSCLHSIAYLIPRDGIGGVEVAARSLPDRMHSGFLLCRYYLASNTDFGFSGDGSFTGSYCSVNDPRAYLQAFAWLRHNRPKLIIFSLWRCYLLMIFYKLLHPRSRVVCFLHCDKAVHFVDWFFSHFAIALADEVWADSVATLSARVLDCFAVKANVISFVLQSQAPVTNELPVPRFVFWGRIHYQKGIDRSISIIAGLKDVMPGIEFVIIGPDCGEKKRLIRLVHDLNLGNSVSFAGPMLREEIVSLVSSCSFYLQASRFEGMAVSVMEAMQLGLVPLVTPVGEVASYCKDGANALFINPDDPLQTVNKINDIYSDPHLFSSLRSQAIHAWAGAPTYREDVLTRCSSLLSVQAK
jgi:glycosyltransferase involved in cell wall biosynthesis